MKIHKAGFSVIAVFLLVLLTINAPLQVYCKIEIVKWIILVISILIIAFVLRFFRVPNRTIEYSDDIVIAPADGKIVAIEDIEEDQFLNKRCKQVSIFMSVWSVHINWFPLLGKVSVSEHFSGRYMAAWLPKSSTENERSVVVLDTPKFGRVLIKQIAGAVARRIITYPKVGDEVKDGDQLGFIRFGSRVDVLLPIDTNINVKLDQMVTGGVTKLAQLKLESK